MTPTIEINATHDTSPAALEQYGPGLIITPPIDGEYWLWRVRVAPDQAIVCFRKFGTIGCGFQREKDWNTNLPITCEAAVIYEHIKHNKQCRATKAKCLAAIEALRKLAAATMPDFAEKAARQLRPA